jgi:hypothetical protein
LAKAQIQAMTRHDLTELTTESFLEQPAVRRLCKHCRWARPAWQVLPMTLLLPYLWPEFWRLATCRHRTSVDPPLRDYVSGKTKEAATAILERGAHH